MIVELTAAAEADLEAIDEDIAQDNPTRALRFVRELFRSGTELADRPEAWPVVPRYESHDVRRRVHGRYLIFFRFEVDRCVVLHVLDGAMDREAILFPNG
jgi:plasmid stabilization system protein ParE